MRGKSATAVQVGKLDPSLVLALHSLPEIVEFGYGLDMSVLPSREVLLDELEILGCQLSISPELTVLLDNQLIR